MVDKGAVRFEERTVGGCIRCKSINTQRFFSPPREFLGNRFRALTPSAQLRPRSLQRKPDAFRQIGDGNSTRL
jgi:hypothetical protein